MAFDKGVLLGNVSRIDSEYPLIVDIMLIGNMLSGCSGFKIRPYGTILLEMPKDWFFLAGFVLRSFVSSDRIFLTAEFNSHLILKKSPNYYHGVMTFDCFDELPYLNQNAYYQDSPSIDYDIIYNPDYKQDERPQ